MGNEVKGSFSPGEFFVFRTGKPNRVIGFVYMAKLREQEELAKLVDARGVSTFQQNVIIILRSLCRGEAFANREMLFIPFPVDMRGIGFVIEVNWAEFIRTAISNKIKKTGEKLPQVTIRLDCLRKGEQKEDKSPWCLTQSQPCSYDNWTECPIVCQDADEILQELSRIDQQQIPIQKYVSQDLIEKDKLL